MLKGSFIMSVTCSTVVMMSCQLPLSLAQHKLLWMRKDALEARFKVKIESPMAHGYTPMQWVYKGFTKSDILFIRAKGDETDLKALEKYVNEAFVHPEVIEIFTYHQDLKAIFESSVWTEIFEEIFNVFINVNLEECELNISGAESSVLSAVSTIEKLNKKYDEYKETLLVGGENALSRKLRYLLKVCRNVDVSSQCFSRVPNAVIVLLLSLLEQIYKDDLPEYSDFLDDSVIIVEPPVEEKPEISVIDLSSDSDDNSPKCGIQSLSAEGVLANKKKESLVLGHKRRKRKRKKHPLLDAKTSLQIPQVGSSTDKCCVPPVVGNPNFIPLSLKSNSTAKRQKQGPGQNAAEAQIPPVQKVVESTPKAPRRLRPIVIDGSNVAFYNACGRLRPEDFSWKRIETCIQYFQKRGHADIKVFIPHYRRNICYEKAGGQNYVEKLEREQLIIFTPSRKIDGKTISCYDDRFIVDLAYRNGGVILSRDNYRDLMLENAKWAETIKRRLLQYIFAGDELMIPEDPLGAEGPRLDEFLCFPEGE